MKPQRTALVLALATLGTMLLLGLAWKTPLSPMQALRTKLKTAVPVQHAQPRLCATWAAQQPIVILALGQSNAGNHGSADAQASAPMALLTPEGCVLAADPLPGSTGAGGSIWLRLSQQLSRHRPQQTWVFSVMGIDATSISDWTDTNSPLRERLLQQLRSMRTLGMAPQLVLWQHGEADAHMGTSSQAYAAGLDQLAALLEQAKTPAPIVLARSTVCRSQPNARIRGAVESRANSHGPFLLGPDTDTLVGTGLRPDGCHFSAAGLDSAAALWVQPILEALSAHF